MSNGSQQTTQANPVMTGETGQSGIQGGSSTPVYDILSPQQNAGMAKASSMSFEDWLGSLGSTLLDLGKQRLQRRVGDASAGLASFQNPTPQQGQHSISIASLYGGGGGS